MRDAGNLGEAARLYGEILRLNPRQFEALYSLGMLYYGSLHFREAEGLLGQAVTVNPQSFEAWYTLGCTMQRLKQPEDAIACYDQAIALKPGYVAALVNRAVCLMGCNRHEEALVSLDAALAVDASAVLAWVNRGSVLRNLGRIDEALGNFDKAVELNPNMPEARVNRGSALFVLKRYADAVVDYEKALAANPEIPYLRGNLLHYRLHCCDWHDLEQERSAIAKGLRDGKLIVQPYVHATISHVPAEQLKCARIATGNEAPASPVPQWRGERYSHDKIRLGYISADFREHAVMRLAAGLFEAHDKSRFTTTALALTPEDGSEMRARLARSFDSFISVERRNDAEAAALFKSMEIDILIDLMGFTIGARPGILAQRPAPIQVNFLGYPGTMGATYVDYIVADRIVIADEHRPYYAEKVVTLPDTYQCNDNKRLIAERTPTRAEADLPEGAFVFCCFNNSSKLLPETFGLWMRVLSQAENSVLWLLETNPAAARNLKHEAEARGVAADRLIFAPRANPPEHLARHRLADLFLDTLPYGAHTTASDALWAGLPVLTLLGKTFAGRVGASLLHAVGLPELVARSPGEYEALALGLARNADALAALKAKLMHNRDACPLFDTARFARNLEAAFTTMWKRQQRGERPDHFAVGPLSP
jgi:predicted O-linked N-acetylglucosamine transferase (SPINDLY family)